MSKKNQQYKSLLSTLANGATGDSRRLLKQYGVPDAKDEVDLQIKLAKLYAEAGDKVQIETEFAKIHPHNKFILKYLSSAQTPAGNVVQNKNDKTQTVKNTIIDEGTTKISSFSGGLEEIKEGVDKMCNCPRCKCIYLTQNPNNFAHFDGTGAQKQPEKSTIDYAGLIGLVAVIGITFYALKKL